MREAIEPRVRQRRDGETETDHPAFGVIAVTNPHGDSVLFGSDLRHSECVRITISGAKMIRNLSNDWLHSQDGHVEFEMSHHQWAQFISGGMVGRPVPITFTWIRGEGSIPGIKPIETKHDTFRREIRDSAEKRLKDIASMLNDLCAAFEPGAGGLSKSAIRASLRGIQNRAEGLPRSLEFVVQQAEEALDKATFAAKAEVEGYIAMRAQELGFKSMDEMAVATRERLNAQPEQPKPQIEIVRPADEA